MTEISNLVFPRFPANKKEGLIPLLQEIQKEQGYLTEELLEKVGKYLNLPANKVYGVAAYYDQFRFRASGQFHIQLCRGTACHLYGSSTYLGVLEKQLKTKVGNTSPDQRFSLEITNCMGACESSPVLRVNDIFYPHVTPEVLSQIIRSLKENII